MPWWSTRSGKAPAVSAAEPPAVQPGGQAGGRGCGGVAARFGGSAGSSSGKHERERRPTCPPCDAHPCAPPHTHAHAHAGAALITLLEAHPNLLTYAASGDGKQLEKGQARASVDVVERGGRKVAGVSYWREGASFEGTPVAPYKPSAL